MNVGILGSGAVAQTLATGFQKHGHRVMIASRSPEKLADFAAANTGIETGTFADAARFGEIVVLTVKGTAALDAMALAGGSLLNGKTVIDTTNPIAAEPPVNGVLKYFTSQNDSLMERLQAAYPDVHFVKAFNSVGNALMVNPQVENGPPTMFICGNHDAAKARVREILEQFGWGAADMGKVEAARAIEPLCMLWCIPGLKGNQWTHAFKLFKM